MRAVPGIPGRSGPYSSGGREDGGEAVHDARGREPDPADGVPPRRLQNVEGGDRPVLEVELRLGGPTPYIRVRREVPDLGGAAERGVEGRGIAEVRLHESELRMGVRRAEVLEAAGGEVVHDGDRRTLVEEGPHEHPPDRPAPPVTTARRSPESFDMASTNLGKAI